VIIAFSELMASNYRTWKKALHISGKEGWYHVFMIIRTFLIVSFSWFFDRSDTLQQSFVMIRQAFTHFDPSVLLQVSAGREGTAFAPAALGIIGAGSVVMVLIGILEERGITVREKLCTKPVIIPFVVYLALLILIGLFGLTGVPRGFIYAQF